MKSQVVTLRVQGESSNGQGNPSEILRNFFVLVLVCLQTFWELKNWSHYCLNHRNVSIKKKIDFKVIIFLFLIVFCLSLSLNLYHWKFFFRPGPWDRISLPRVGDSNKPATCDSANRTSLTDWNKYSGMLFYPPFESFDGSYTEMLFYSYSSFILGMLSCSDDEMPPSDSEEESPPSRDHPHLRFEITSDDGFSVEAESIEGMRSRPCYVSQKSCGCIKYTVKLSLFPKKLTKPKSFWQ